MGFSSIINIGGCPKSHFAAVSPKITFDYKRVVDSKSLEKRLFGHIVSQIDNYIWKSIK
jgi:hypothetical protein